MRKILAAAVCLAGLPCLAHADTTSFELDAGVLRTSTLSGATPLPDGTLLQLIASPTGTFTAPTATSFTSGNETVIDSFALNATGSTGLPASTGNPGEIDDQITITLTTTVTAGESFELRWYPGLTIGSTAPGAGATYGEHTSPTSEDMMFATSFGDSPYVLPAASSNGTLILFTTASSQFLGPYPDAAGDADETVAGGTPLPEPSTYAMMGFAALGLAGMKFRQRRTMRS